MIRDAVVTQVDSKYYPSKGFRPIVDTVMGQETQERLDFTMLKSSRLIDLPGLTSGLSREQEMCLDFTMVKRTRADLAVISVKVST